MQDLRVLFEPATAGGYRAHLADAEGTRLGVEGVHAAAGEVTAVPEGLPVELGEWLEAVVAEIGRGRQSHTQG